MGGVETTTRGLVALLAALLLSGPALAQVGDTIDVASPFSPAWFGDEPNTPAPGRLPFGTHPTDTVTEYGADRNGFSRPQVTRARVLQATPMADTPVAFLDTGGAMERFAGDAFLLPGVPYQFVAWYGDWLDHNEDGWLTDGSASATDVTVNAEGTRDCGRTEVPPSPRLDDRDGALGQVSHRCRGVDEWGPASPPLGVGSLVGYVTPYVPVYTMPLNSLGAEQTRQPDLFFAEVSSSEGGRYAATAGAAANWDVHFTDNSLLQTTVVEVHARPRTTTAGPRLYVHEDADPLARTDTDVFRSVNGDLETIYRVSLLQPLAEAGCDLDHAESAVSGSCPEPLHDALRPVLDPLTGAGSAEALVGPTLATLRPTWPQEDSGHDHASGFHPYLDLRLEMSGWRDAVLVAQNEPVVAASWSYTADGAHHVPLVASVYGWLGLWNDLDGDGFVGDAEAGQAAGCPDAYSCGARADPNTFEDASSRGEWNGLCRAGVGYGVIDVVLSTPDGRWGPTGVYVLTDGHEEGATMVSTARVVDATVEDAVQGDVQTLVLNGPVVVHANCGWVGEPGRYRGYEQVLFPAGNLGFDVALATDDVDVAFDRDGAPAIETVRDDDVYPAWAA